MTVASWVLLGHGGLGLGHCLLPQACPGVTLASLEPDQFGAREAEEASCGGRPPGWGGGGRGLVSVVLRRSSEALLGEPVWLAGCVRCRDRAGERRVKVGDAAADPLDLLTWPKRPAPTSTGTSWLDWGPPVGRQVVLTGGLGQVAPEWGGCGRACWSQGSGAEPRVAQDTGCWAPS